MLVERPARKHRAISMTPLVDVIFLLLLFFMLSSTFTTFGQVEIGAPASGGGTGTVPKAMLLVDGENLRLNGEGLDVERLADAAQALTARDINTLLVLVRGDTTTQQLVSIIARLKSVPELTLTVAGGS